MQGLRLNEQPFYIEKNAPVQSVRVKDAKWRGRLPCHFFGGFDVEKLAF
jgi:hypothetical protein